MAIIVGGGTDVGIRDVRFGPLRFITTFENLTETLGEGLEVVAGGLAPGDRRPRPFPLALPVRGHVKDADQFAEGEKLRRQVRALIDNSQARLQGFYFTFAQDPDLNGWLLVGAADLAYEDGGVSFADYKLTLSDVYVIGRRRTHRPGRRLEAGELRGGGSARDTLERIYSTDFAAQPAYAVHYLPVGATDPVDNTGVPVATTTVVSGEGDLLAIHDRKHGEAVSFEQAEADLGKGDVKVYDRRGVSGLPAATQTDHEPHGWEAVYGSNYPLTGGDIPVVTNQVCRVRWIAGTGFAVDEWVAGTGFVERHRVGVGAGTTLAATIVSSTVVEWTPERAAVSAVLTTSTSRVRVYVTVQRGWRFPRFEVYAHPRAGQTAEQGLIVYAPDATGLTFGAFGTGGGGYSDDPGLTWAGTNVAPLAGAAEGWVNLIRTADQTRNLVLAASVAQGGIYGRSDTALYGGAARNAVELRGGNTATGYASLMAGYGATTVPVEAESIRNAVATTAQVADAAASGGQAVEDSQVLTSLSTANGDQNFARNPNFEYDAVKAAPAVWASYHARVSDGAVISNFKINERWVDTVWAFSGTKSLYRNHHPGNNADRYIYDTLGDFGAPTGAVPVAASTAYTWAAKVNVTKASGGVVGGVSFYTSAGAFLSLATTAIQTGAGVKTLVYNVTSPATAAFAVPFVRTRVNRDGSATWHTDAAMFLRGTYTAPYTTPGYFDGDTAGYQWEGAKGNSTSSKQLTVAPAVTLTRALTETVGVYGLWARVRAVDAGASVTVRTDLSGGTTAPGDVTIAGNAYQWAYIGALDHSTAGETLNVRLWRAVGTGNARVDRILLVPLSGAGGYTGAREVGGRALLDSRQHPALITR